MPNKRQLNNIDPVRRSDIDALLKTAPVEQIYSGEIARGRNFTRIKEEEETILRWYRILTNDQAMAASGAGQIPEVGLTDNNLKKRDVVPCLGGPAIPEPAPSMWAIQITRYNCQVIYQDRRDRYDLVRFPSIPDSGVNLTTIGNALKDERVLCWWNSNSGHWETESIGNTTTPAEPQPGADNVTFVSIDQTIGGANQCAFQQRNDQCLWPGHKLIVDSGGNHCSQTSAYSDGDAVWIVGIEGCIKIHKLDLREKFLALKIADSLDVNGDVRQLWGIRPDYDHPMEWVFVSDSLAFQWQEPDATHCVYDGSIHSQNINASNKTLAKRRESSAPLPGNECLHLFSTIEFTVPVYCSEVNARQFARNRYYLGWKEYDEYDINGVKRPLFRFDSAFPPQQIVRYFGSDTITVLNTTQLPISLASLGAIYGVARNASNEITFIQPGRYRVDLCGEFLPGPGEHVQCRLILEQWNDALAAWQIKDEVRVMSWDSNLLNFWDTSAITVIVDIAEGDKLRMMVANPSALRVVNVNRALLTIEAWYEDAV